MPLAIPLVVFPILLISITFLILWYTSRPVLIGAMTALLQSVPIIGGYLVQRNLELINIIERWVGDRLESAAGAFVNALDLVETRIRWLITNTLTGLEVTADALEHLVSVWVPQAIGVAADFAHHEFLMAWSWSITLYHRAVDELGAEIQRATAATLTLLNDLRNQVEQEILTLILGQAATVALSQALNADTLKKAQAGIIDVRNEAIKLVTDAEAIAAGDAAKTLAAATALTIPLALGIAEIKNLDCIKLCNPLSLMGNAIEALDLAALLLLVAEAANDPKGTAALVEETVGPAVEVGATLYRSLGGR